MTYSPVAATLLEVSRQAVDSDERTPGVPLVQFRASFIDVDGTMN